MRYVDRRLRIYSELADSNAGLVSKIVLLFDTDMHTAHHLALQHLAEITHHDAKETCQCVEVFMHVPTLLRIMGESPDCAKTSELAVTVVSHAVDATLGSCIPNGALAKTLDVKQLLTLFLPVDAMQRPNASDSLLSHASRLVLSLSRHCPEEVAS